jgi:diketogulonate reductase-like aldo/keto reductase
VFVVTKIEENDDAYAATCTNLDELGLDYADLVLVHRPPETGAGAELFGGLQQARYDSLVRRIGVSNYSVDLIDHLAAESGEMPAVNQVEWSPFGWNPEVLAACQERGILVQAYCPLTRAKRLADTTLTRVANRYSRSPGQILLRWHLQIGVVPLPKASSIEHLGQNARIFDFELSAADMDELGGLNEHWSALSDQTLHA